MSDTVMLVGCGNMGRAMLKGWLKNSSDISALVVEPDADLREAAAALGAQVFAKVSAVPASVMPDLVFLAVKPQVMASVLPDYAHYDTTFVSVAAGVTVDTLRQGLGGAAPVIRCMPNTPAAIGQGMMVCYGTEEVSDRARGLTDRLLATSGEVAWIDEENLMDAVTAVSGSGPAYVFHLIECLGAAGEAAGLPADLSAQLALQTVMGAGKLAAMGETPPGTLREQVTSPGGTTAAALSVMMEGGRFQTMMTEAVEAARARGEELGAA
ncbi:MAG: pyrroline-5-carboxylate reductase [Pikeienuella sp.]